MGHPVVMKQDVSATKCHPLQAKQGNWQRSEYWYLGVALGHLASTGHSNPWAHTLAVQEDVRVVSKFTKSIVLSW